MRDLDYAIDAWITREDANAEPERCKFCNEELYDYDYDDYCSEECIMGDYKLTYIDTEVLCPHCRDNTTEYSKAVQDETGDIYCSGMCYLSHNKLRQ